MNELQKDLEHYQNELKAAQDRLQKADCKPCMENAMRQIKEYSANIQAIEAKIKSMSTLNSLSEITTSKEETINSLSDLSQFISEAPDDYVISAKVEGSDQDEITLSGTLTEVEKTQEEQIQKDILDDFMEDVYEDSDDESDFTSDGEFYEHKDLKSDIEDDSFNEELEDVEVTASKPSPKKKFYKNKWFIIGAVAVAVIVGLFIYFKRKK